MDITSEHREGEITVFVNSATPEVQLTTRREEAKATVNENEQSIITVAENIESVKDAAKYVDTFDDVIASLPKIMEATTAAQRAEKAEEGATEAKDLSVESAAIASASASSATLSAQKASESEAKALASEQSAQNSANSASESKTSAQNSALLAAESATSAKQDLASIKADAEMVAEYAPKAIQAAESAEIAKASAISAAERAEQASQGVEGALAGKQDKLTAGEGITIDGNVISATGGGGSVPDNVYTQDNLIAGKNVTFSEVLPEGGIDEHTLACWHFDDSASDEVSGFVMDRASTLYSGYSKFGEKSLQMLYSTYASDISSLGLQPIKKSMTMDFWLYNHGSNPAIVGIRKEVGNSYGNMFEARIKQNGSISISGTLFESSISLSETIPVNFNHYAMQYDYENQEVSFYLNGKNLVKTKVPNVNLPVAGFNYLELSCYTNNSFISELRISDCVRYTEDFTPPTEPYKVAEGPSKTAVNAIVAVPTKTSELENDSGFLTGLPDNVYTAENLVAGDNIVFAPKKAMPNADIVGSPVISDNYEASGFSDSNYLKFVDPIASASKYDSLEIGFAFKANTLNTENAGIYDGGSNGGCGYRITLTTDGKIRTRIITDSSGSYGIDITGATTLATNKKYYAKVKYSSETGYTLSLKEEDGEWVVDASATTTTKPYSNGERDIWIGDNKATGLSFDGTIYLPEMYINIDGKRVWAGFLPDRTVVSTDNVYTKTNLLGGKDIEIIPEPVEGGIDEHTLACWHFDSDKKDVVTSLSLTRINSISTDYVKFGAGSARANIGTAYASDISSIGINPIAHSVTLDFWGLLNTSSNSRVLRVGFYDGMNGYSYLGADIKIDSIQLFGKVVGGSYVYLGEFNVGNVFNHYVLQYDYENKKVSFYFNGKKCHEQEATIPTNKASFNYLMTSQYDGSGWFDELRISDCVRYTEDFTPPTQPYRLAEPTGNYQINYTGNELPDSADYVVESYNDENGNWYRVYKSGWVEQGGMTEKNSTGNTVTYLKAFKDEKYTLLLSKGNNKSAYVAAYSSKTATGFVETQFQSEFGSEWYACGQGA